MKYIELPNSVVAFLLDNNLVVDGIRGGLVLGRRHSEGGIYLLMLCDGKFYACGNIEGGEYLVNFFATQENIERLEEIKDDRPEGDDSISSEDIESVRHIVVPPGHWLRISKGASMILSRASSKRHLKELDEINGSTQYIFDQYQGQE